LTFTTLYKTHIDSNRKYIYEFILANNIYFTQAEENVKLVLIDLYKMYFSKSGKNVTEK